MYACRSAVGATRATKYSPTLVIGLPVPQPLKSPRTWTLVRVGAQTLKTVPPPFTGVAPTGACESFAKSTTKPLSAGTLASFIPSAL